MRREEVSEDLSALAFDFFFWFSRFEFSLKENGYLKSHDVGANAQPGWKEFVNKWKDRYTATPEAQSLLADPPKKQIVTSGDRLDWQPVGLDDCDSDLERVVRLLKTVRNNLFHGGKHGAADWDSPQRTQRLIEAGTSVLDQLASLAQMEGGFKRYY